MSTNNNKNNTHRKISGRDCGWRFSTSLVVHKDKKIFSFFLLQVNDDSYDDEDGYGDLSETKREGSERYVKR